MGIPGKTEFDLSLSWRESLYRVLASQGRYLVPSGRSLIDGPRPDERIRFLCMPSGSSLIGVSVLNAERPRSEVPGERAPSGLSSIIVDVKDAASRVQGSTGHIV